MWLAETPYCRKATQSSLLSLHLISLSLSFHVLITSFPLPMHTIPFLLSTRTTAGLWSPLPIAIPQSITAVRLVPYFPGPSPHTNTKHPHAVPILTSSSCFPNLPRCWLTASSSSPNPPRLLCPLQWPLLPTFQTPLIFSTFLPFKPLLEVRKESQQQTSQHPEKKNQHLQLLPSEVPRPPALTCSLTQMAERLRERSHTLTWHIAPN